MGGALTAPTEVRDMNWSLRLKLLPGEVILDRPDDKRTFGIKTVHTPILTNQRALFKFNSLSSGMVQCFPYDEIDDARPANRLMIKYLRLICGSNEYYLNVDVPEEWALKILGYKEMQEQSAGAPGSAEELEANLRKLHAAGVLTDEELNEKLGRLKG